MHGGMGIDISKNHQVVVLEKKVGVGLTVGDFAEQAIRLHGRRLLVAVSSPVAAGQWRIPGGWKSGSKMPVPTG